MGKLRFANIKWTVLLIFWDFKFTVEKIKKEIFYFSVEKNPKWKVT